MQFRSHFFQKDAWWVFGFRMTRGYLQCSSACWRQLESVRVVSTVTGIMLLAGSVAYGALQASRRLHEALLSNVLKCPMSFFDTTPLGRIINRFSKDVDTMDAELRMFIQVRVGRTRTDRQTYRHSHTHTHTHTPLQIAVMRSHMRRSVHAFAQICTRFPVRSLVLLHLPIGEARFTTLIGEFRFPTTTGEVRFTTTTGGPRPTPLVVDNVRKILGHTSHAPLALRLTFAPLSLALAAELDGDGVSRHLDHHHHPLLDAHLRGGRGAAPHPLRHSPGEGAAAGGR